MADNATTVDELSLEISAKVTTAVSAIKDLSASIGALNAALGPAMGNLKELKATLNAAKGAAPALKVAMKAAAVATKDAGAQAKVTQTQIRDLVATFRTVKGSLAAGLIPANAALTEMSSLASRTGSAITNLKLIAEKADLDIPFKKADADLSRMKRDVDALRTSLKTIPPAVDKSAAAFQRYRAGLTAFQQTSRSAVVGSPNFTANIDQAKRQLGTMKSSLATLAREMGVAFDHPAMGRYVSSLTAAQNRLDRLVASQKQFAYYASLKVTAAAPTAMMPSALSMPTAGMFPSAPFTNVTAQANAAKAAVDKVTASVEKMGTRGVKSTNFLAQSFIQLRSKIFFALFALMMLKKMFDASVGAAMAYIEKVNLFGVTMGEVAGEADAFASRIENALGIDPAAFRESYSTFYMMAHSLGMTADAANKVSQNFTQLAYDYASLREMSFSDVEAKFRSAMAGQTRAVAALGLDVTLTSLAEEALREGISGNVAEFTKANKIILMHNLIMRQSQVVQGDLARTITSPSNMLRILKDQFAIAARTIGFLFIPMLQAVLPWLITLTNALTMAARAFLGLFGISMPDWESQVGSAVGGVDDLFDGMSGVEDATGGAADNMKKLRDYTLGIDELNILEPEQPSGNGSNGGNGGVGGAMPPIDPFDVYDMIGGIDGLKKIMEPVLAIFEKIGVALDPFIKALGRAWEAFKPFISNVWEGFKFFYTDILVPLAVWTMNTVGVFVLDQLTKVLNWFNEHPKIAELLGGVLGALSAFAVLNKLTGLTNIITFLVNFLPLIGELGFMGALSAAFPMLASFVSYLGGIGSAIVGLFSGEGFAAVAAAIGPTGWIVLGIAAVVAAGLWLYDNWDMVSQKATEVWEWVTTAWENIKTATATTWDTIVTYFSGIWETIETTFAKPIDFVTNLISTAWEEISTTTDTVWTWISAVLKTIWETIVAIVSVPVAMIGTLIIKAWNWLSTETTRIWGIISGGLRTVWNGIITFMTPIWNTIKGVVATVWDWLKGATKSAWDWVWDKIEGPVNDIKNLVDRVFPLIKSTIREVWDGLTDGLEGAWNTIKSIFKTGANSIIRSINEGPIAVLNKIIDAAKEVDITGVMKKVRHVSTIPYLARGGVVGLGQMFVAGESGAELVGSYGGSKSTVMPLEESGFVEAMAAAVYSATVSAMASSSSGGSGDVYLNGQVVGQLLRDDERRSGVGASLVKVSI